MKARVKATGEVIEVRKVTSYDESFNAVIYFKGEDGISYKEEQLDFENLTAGADDVKERILPKDEPDYWEKLRHKVASGSMLALLPSYENFAKVRISEKVESGEGIPENMVSLVNASFAELCADLSVSFADALVKRLKEESK